MVRRVATQVHKQVARLSRAGYIRNEPIWYKCVLEHPPISLPPRTPPNRLNADGQAYDLPRDTQGKLSQKLASKPTNAKPVLIVYIEDEVRRQFYHDHPFEALRERSLIETATLDDEPAVRGAAWTRLSQRGRNPSPEDAIRFAANLYEHTPKMSLVEAYITSIMQYRSLRSEQHIMAQVAIAEAEYYGAKFGPGPIERGLQFEQKNLRSWTEEAGEIQRAALSNKRWRISVEHPKEENVWSKGREYVRLWKEGNKPDTSLLASPLEDAAADELQHIQSYIV